MNTFKKTIRNNKTLIILAIIISISITVIIHILLYQENIQYIDIDYNISKHKIGFNVDEDAVHFGVLMPGTTGERALDIRSDYDAILKFELINISSIYIPYKQLIAKKGETSRVTLFAIIPKNITEGYYNGLLKIIFYRL